MLTYPLFLGLTLGVRHAADPDHVATIATVVLGRTSLGGALRTAVLWGLGHTLTFLAVGLGIVLFGLHVPEAFETTVEIMIASTLLALGTAQLLRTRRAAHTHDHGPAPHPARSVALGGMHGLAGSAGVALLALSTIPSQAEALLYLLVFGIGTMLGMALITLLIAWGFRLTSSVAWAQRALTLTAGVVSCVVGLMIFGELIWA
ncbi:MAG: hypothetical protein ABW252_08040 [Polyangiales bacterium]